MERRIATVIVGVLLTVTAASVSAQQAAQPDYLSVLPGIVFPERSLGTEGHGFTFSTLYGHPLAERVSLEINLNGSIFETGPVVGTDYYQQGASADLVYNLGAGRESHLTPFLVAGLGAVHDEFWPMSRDGIAVAANAGVGLVSPPLFKNGLRLRLEARYVYDAKESSHGEPRVSLGIEVPIGHVQHVVEYRTVKEIEVHETVREVPRPRDDTDDTQTRCPGTPPEMRVQADSCALAKQTVELRGVTFEFNKARLMPNAETVLDVVAQAFIDQPGLQVEVAGHTDSIGSVATNLALSQRRAEAVRNYLIKHGARPDSLTARGYGKSHLLIHPETGEQDRERNRRVELSVVAVQ